MQVTWHFHRITLQPSKDCYQWGPCIKPGISHQIKSNKISTEPNWYQQIYWPLPNKRVQCSYRHKTKFSTELFCEFSARTIILENKIKCWSGFEKNMNSSLPLRQAVLSNVPAIKSSNVFFCELHFVYWPNSITLFCPIEFEKWIFDFLQFIFLVCEFQFILIWRENCTKLQNCTMPPPPPPRHLSFHLNQTLEY